MADNIIIQIDKLVSRKKYLDDILAKANVNMFNGQCDNALYMKIIINNLILLNHMLVKYKKYDMQPILEIIKKYDYKNMTGGASLNDEEQKIYDGILESIFKGFRGDDEYIEYKTNLGEFAETINDFILNGKLTNGEFKQDVDAKIKQYKSSSEKELFRNIIDDINKKEFDKINEKNASDVTDNDLAFYVTFEKTYPVMNLLGKITHNGLYTKYKYVALFNELIKNKPLPITAISMPSKTQLKNIYNSQVIPINTWKMTFSDNILKSINIALSETDKTIDDYKNMYNLAMNKISVQQTSDNIKKIFTDNNIDFNVKEFMVLEQLLEYIFNYYSGTFKYSDPTTNYMTIYNKIYGKIAENKKNKNITNAINILIKNNTEVLQSAIFTTLYIQIYVIDEIIAYNSDNFNIVVKALIKNIDNSYKKLHDNCKNNINVYSYSYSYILITIHIFFSYLSQFYKTGNINIYMPEYNIQEDMPLIKKNNLYMESAIEKFIGNYLNNIDKSKLTIKEQETMNYFNKVKVIADKKISAIFNTQNNNIKSIMNEFNKSKFNPKIGNDSKTISEYAQYYINKLKSEPNTDRQQNIINAYAANYKYVAHIRPDGSITCRIAEQQNDQKSYDILKNCLNDINNSYIFYFRNNSINVIMEQFWKNRRNPKIGTDFKTIIQYADEYVLQLSGIPEIDKTSVDYTNAVNMINYYKKNYKWIVRQTKKGPKCTVSLPRKTQQSFNTRNECIAYIKAKSNK